MYTPPVDIRYHRLGRVTFGIVNQPIQGMVLFTTCCHVVGLWRTFAMFADLPPVVEFKSWTNIWTI